MLHSNTIKSIDISESIVELPIGAHATIYRWPNKPCSSFEVYFSFGEKVADDNKAVIEALMDERDPLVKCVLLS